MVKETVFNFTETLKRNTYGNIFFKRFRADIIKGHFP